MPAKPDKLKKRSPYPIQIIAAAVAFSPRLEAVLSEAKYLSDTLKSSLILIHIGPKTPTKGERLDKMMQKLGMDAGRVRIIWMEGNPVNSILDLCRLHAVDLLIIGALAKENLLNYYLGSVARNISRKAKCSVLLLTKPQVDAGKPRKIIVSGTENPKTINTINTVLYLAARYSIGGITVVREVENPVLSMTIADSSTAPEARQIRREMMEEEEGQLKDVLNKCKSENIDFEIKTIKGKAGYAIAKYARDKKADLLVINSPDTHLTLLDRIFTHDIEYILADLPCNVLIVHSRV